MTTRIQVCPSCGSREIHYELGGITGQLYRCKDCGYVGPLILEQDVEEEG